MTPEIPKGLAPIPKGWEKCGALIATDFLTASGLIYPMQWNGKEGDPAVMLGDTKIWATEFEVLGITHVRKVKVQPIEFTIKRVLSDGTVVIDDGRFDGHGIDFAALIGKTFREVTE